MTDLSDLDLDLINLAHIPAVMMRNQFIFIFHNIIIEIRIILTAPVMVKLQILIRIINRGNNLRLSQK